jgi:rod shape-determining protein MreB and related proteins
LQKEVIMIRRLINKLGSTIYVQIWENRIKVTDTQTGEVYDEAPLVAIETNPKGQKIIAAVGNEVKSIVPSSEMQIVNPFSHPRALLNDFFVAEKLLQHAFHLLLGKKFISPTPLVVIQPMEKLEGGLTMIERKAFTEMALGAGAREVALHQGSELLASNIDFKKIKADSIKNLNSQIELKPKKENYLALVFWVAVIVGVVWLSN